MMGMLILCLLAISLIEAKVLIPKCDTKIEVYPTLARSLEKNIAVEEKCFEITNKVCENEKSRECTRLKTFCSLILAEASSMIRNNSSYGAALKKIAEIVLNLVQMAQPMFQAGTMRSFHKPRPIEKNTGCHFNCPKIYRPVCGDDSRTKKTYPNECVLKYTACSQQKSILKVKNGPC